LSESRYTARFSDVPEAINQSLTRGVENISQSRSRELIILLVLLNLEAIVCAQLHQSFLALNQANPHKDHVTVAAHFGSAMRDRICPNPFHPH
jgi:hypothetical protein